MAHFAWNGGSLCMESVAQFAVEYPWIRIGWNFPVSQSAGQHGALMVGSFLTTVILLERAITFKNRNVLLLPFINGLSGVFSQQETW